MSPYTKDARFGLSKKKFCDELVMSATGLRRDVSPNMLLFSTIPPPYEGQVSSCILEKP